jgi:regulator of replication initiation timing
MAGVFTSAPLIKPARVKKKSRGAWNPYALSKQLRTHAANVARLQSENDELRTLVTRLRTENSVLNRENAALEKVLDDLVYPKR